MPRVRTPQTAEPARLSLRWLIIMTVAGSAGAATGVAAGWPLGVGTIVGLAAGLHTFVGE
jgi:hypothetical protein